MRTAKRVTPIMDGINRRFFIAIGALVSSGRIKSLGALCEEFGLHSPRYREMRLTYGITPNPISKPSRYVNIEMDAISQLCDKYSVSAEWLLLGRGEIFRNETLGEI